MPQHVDGSNVPPKYGRPPIAEPRSRPRWWLQGALVGLVVGWIIGLVVIRPGADDLLNAALSLVPEATEVTETGVGGEDFELIAFVGPPRAFVHVTTDLTPEELTEEFEKLASAQGWTVLPRVHHPNAIEVPLQSLLLRGRATSLLSGTDGRIGVRRHDWTGRVLTGTSSIAGALWGGILAWYMSGRRKEGGTQEPPLRWWHWVGLVVLAAIWLLALSVIR